MKQDIHPDYHEITVKKPNGETFTTRSTYGKKGDVLQLDVDPATHPAWTGGTAFLNEKAGRVAKFNEKFAGFSFGGKKEAPKAEAQAAPAETKKEDKPETSEEAK